MSPQVYRKTRKWNNQNLKIALITSLADNSKPAMRYRCLFLILLTCCSGLAATVLAPPQLQKAVETLYRFPKTRAILASLDNGRRITLRWVSLGKEGHTALWHGGNREIWLNSSQSWEEGKKITYILMELHNALTNEEFAHLDHLVWQKKLSKREYVHCIEKIEHINALKTRDLLKEGIARGFFPPTAQYEVYPNFADHLRLQIAAGHSTYIAQRFEELQGT